MPAKYDDSRKIDTVELKAEVNAKPRKKKNEPEGEKYWARQPNDSVNSPSVEAVDE